VLRIAKHYLHESFVLLIPFLVFRRKDVTDLTLEVPSVENVDLHNIFYE
jgi:hypothetical protein